MAQGITRRGPSQYLVRIRRRGHVISRTFDTLAAAERFRDVTIGELTGDTYVDRSLEQRTTLREVLERYRTEVTPAKKGARQETARLKEWMKEPFASLPVISITPSHIVKWRDRRLAEGAAPTTISNPLNLLSSVFKIAIAEWGFRLTNPCTGVRRPKAREPRNAYLTPENEVHLLTACRLGPAWLEWMVRLAVETAMRQSEIRRLEWSHLHNSHIHLPETKNGSSRNVPLTDAAAGVITAMRTALHRQGDRWVFGPPDEMAKDGGRPDWQVHHAFRRAVARAVADHGIPHITFHDLRHVAITRLRYLHVDALDLAQTTGHRTLAVLKRYDNELPEVRADLIRARERALGQV